MDRSSYAEDSWWMQAATEATRAPDDDNDDDDDFDERNFLNKTLRLLVAQLAVFLLLLLGL